MMIETVPVGDLAFDPMNARRHDEANLKAIAGSLELFGQRKPIVVTEAGVVVAGNGTLQAAKSLGWSLIDVVRVPGDWSDDQVKAFALADNRSAELASWDEQVMASQLLELEAAGYVLEDFGFVAADAPVDPESVVEDDVPELPSVAKSKLGQVYQLGRHRLMCGSSTNADNMETLLGGVKADLVFTDPPYGVAYTGGLQFKDGYVERNNREMIVNDDLDIYEDVMAMLTKYAAGPCYIWFAGSKGASIYAAAEKYGDIHALLIWVKNGGYGALNANYKQKHEPCLYWKPNGTTLNFIGTTTETTIWNIDKDGKNKLHPTQKPVALAAKAIGNHECSSVLDMFGGSGATLIAAEQMNKSCFMMELDPQYVDVIIERWETLTGNKAELVS